MISNLERYKKDLDRLILEGEMLLYAMLYESLPELFEKQEKEVLKAKEYKEFIKKLPSFKQKYQSWYSEALALIKLLLPDRYSDFVRLYEKPKNRKKLEYGNYVIEDYLQGLFIKNGFGEERIGPRAAIPQFQQQLNIVKSIQRRFESSLFDIQQLVQANLFNSEVDVAKELLENGFLRAAGAVAGVAIEKHLKQVCSNHKVKVKKKNPHISDYNDILKNGIIDTPNWRFIQRLADIRNLCVHKKDREPTKDEVDELIKGTEKLIKTLF